MLTEQYIFDNITILEDGQIQLRQSRVIYSDGVEIARTYHRQVIEPDQDISPIPDVRVQSITNVIWTQKVKDDYIAKKAAKLLRVSNVKT